MGFWDAGPWRTAEIYGEKKTNTWTTWIPQIADLLTKKETFSKSKQFVLLLKADCYSQQNAEFGSPSQRWYRPRLPQCPCSPQVQN